MTRVPRRGMVLIIVMVVIAVLSLAALTFSELMLNERRAARLSGRQAQAQAFRDPPDLTRGQRRVSPHHQDDRAFLHPHPAGQVVRDDPPDRHSGHLELLARAVVCLYEHPDGVLAAADLNDAR